MKKQTKKKVEKKVKGWVILNERKDVVTIEIGARKPERFTVGTWLFFTDNFSAEEIVPCTITYSLPKKPNNKK